MPPIYDKKLTEPQALVLFVIWRAKQQAKKAKLANEPADGSLVPPAANGSQGLTNVQIHEAMQIEFARLNKEKGDSFGNIKKIIDVLSTWKPTPLLDTAAREGKAAAVYRLAKDLVKWPTAATMLIHLETEPDGPVMRTAFVQQMLSRRMKNLDGTPFSKEQIEQSLDFCENMVCPYISEDKNGFITTTARVDSEKRFLELIQHPQQS